MLVLVVGSGGREHALAWGLAQEGAEVLVAPGNGGTREVGENVPAGDPASLVECARKRGVELCVIGPEAPIAQGLADLFRDAGIPTVGPGRQAAYLEASKVEAKAFMGRHGIPTAPWRAFSSRELREALRYVRDAPLPLVVKADGLAAGKGVTVARTRREAEGAVRANLERKRFGPASERIVVETHLEGREVSVFAACDGESWTVLGAAQDYKRRFAGDRGPNTGGMGAMSPVPWLTPPMERRILEEVVAPTFRGLEAEGIRYQGILYFGLIWTGEGPRVLEYNVRFGDPEAQVLVPRMRNLLSVLSAVAQGGLAEVEPQLSPEAAVCVVLVSPGYPGKGAAPFPLELRALKPREGMILFHAGTREEAGRTMAVGGRVLNAVGLGCTVAEARARAYALAEEIRKLCPQLSFREDIAAGD